MAIPTLILSGPVGSGKTSVMMALSVMLAADGVAHTAVDLDALSYTFPAPDDDPYRQRLVLSNLRDVWQNACAAGSRHLILARVVEDADELDGYREAVPGAQITICRLTAPLDVIHARLRTREQGEALEWHLARAAELLPQLEASGPATMVIANTGKITETAAEILKTLRQSQGWT